MMMINLRLSVVLSLVAILTVGSGMVHLYAQTVSGQVSVQDAMAFTASETSNYKFAERDWQALTSHSHTATVPPEEQVSSFVMAMLGGVPDSAMQDMTVCSASFFKLSESDRESLVASIDVNGRHFCNLVVVIYRTPYGLRVGMIDVVSVDDVSVAVRGLGKGGKNVLVVPTPYSAYEGVKCMATWSRIYRLHAGTLVDKSSEFTSFYKERLRADEVALQCAEERNKPCIQMESDKIVQFLGTSANAGADRAKRWIDSSDESLRLKGIATLADIGDRDAIKTLERLSRDSDALVADEAKRAVVVAQKKLSAK
jgi:hypothetical protein